MIKAIEVASWFYNKGISATNTKSDNMKYNKLLSFSQLIYFIENNEKLFNEEMYAFENGLVIKEFMDDYRLENFSVIEEMKNKKDIMFTKSQLEVLNAVYDIFGGLSSKELSELSHKLRMWKEYYNKSLLNNGEHWMCKSLIDFDVLNDIYSDDLNKLRDIYEQYNEFKDEEIYEFNGSKFHYDPQEVKITKEVINKIRNFKGTIGEYSIGSDNELGVVIY